MTEKITLPLKSDPNASLAERLAHPLACSGGRIEPDKLYSPTQVSAILGVGLSTLRRWRAQGTGPMITRLVPGGPPRYRGQHVLEALEEAAEG
ncbi:helix-turn-helix domain-containing protein [Primorskyibacter sp. S87]|uniref:helix-turn-helix domain-containing protein n=1 Tax=Primorskyibacter sp. S87 TaxID=3415126 RepID=UPI003C7A85E3